VYLHQATDSEKKERDFLTFEAWGSFLSMEQYAAREQRLRAHPWAKSAMRTWFLRNEQGQTVASCETFAMPLEFTKNQNTQRGNLHGVASVYTEPKFRGQRFASQLMEKVVKSLPEVDSKSLASALYSDVGAAIYARSGYQLRPAVSWSFPAKASPVSSKVTWIREQEVQSWFSMPPAPEGELWGCLTGEQLDWHLERQRFYAQQLEKQCAPYAAVMVGNSSLVWTIHPGEQKMLGLWFTAENPDDGAFLVQAAQNLAHEYGYKELELWATPLPFSAEPWLEQCGAHITNRTSSLPMLCSLHDGIEAANWNYVHRGYWV
jgi:GNAT superfamily N-acetyltransferase